LRALRQEGLSPGAARKMLASESIALCRIAP